MGFHHRENNTYGCIASLTFYRGDWLEQLTIFVLSPRLTRVEGPGPGVEGGDPWVPDTGDAFGDRLIRAVSRPSYFSSGTDGPVVSHYRGPIRIPHARNSPHLGRH